MTDASGHDHVPEDAPGFFINRHFLVDLSVENPYGRLPDDVLPQLRLDHGVHIETKPLDQPNLHQVDIWLRLTVAADAQPVFVTELNYRAEVELKLIPDPVVPQTLNVDVPEALTPMLQDVFSSATRHSGYPDLKLHNLDFRSLFNQSAAAIPPMANPS